MGEQTCARACARCMEKCHTQACRASSRSPLRLSLHAFFCTDRMTVYRSQPSTSLHHTPASDLTDTVSALLLRMQVHLVVALSVCQTDT